MTERVSRLFEDYMARFVRGEHPDPSTYLADAGAEANELRELIDGFLRTVAPPDPTPEMVEVMAAWIRGESPLLDLRRRKGTKPAEVVDVLISELGIDESKRRRVARYYHRLEGGLLDLARVDGRVFAALAKALGVGVSDLAFPGRPAGVGGGGAYLRSSEAAEELLEVRLESLDRVEERDEVDELFEGAP